MGSIFLWAIHGVQGTSAAIPHPAWQIPTGAQSKILPNTKTHV